MLSSPILSSFGLGRRSSESVGRIPWQATLSSRSPLISSLTQSTLRSAICIMSKTLPIPSNTKRDFVLGKAVWSWVWSLSSCSMVTRPYQQTRWLRCMPFQSWLLTLDATKFGQIYRFAIVMALPHLPPPTLVDAALLYLNKHRKNKLKETWCRNYSRYWGRSRSFLVVISSMSRYTTPRSFWIVTRLAIMTPSSIDYKIACYMAKMKKFLSAHTITSGTQCTLDTDDTA